MASGRLLGMTMSLVGLAPSRGCARTSAPESAAVQPAERHEPPRMLQRGAPPELRIYGIPASGRLEVRIETRRM